MRSINRTGERRSHAVARAREEPEIDPGIDGLSRGADVLLKGLAFDGFPANQVG